MQKQNFLKELAGTSAAPIALSSILLVEQSPRARNARRILLHELDLPVLAVSGYAEVCQLPADNNCRLVVIDLEPSEQEAARIAAHVRRQWPAVRILLVGHPADDFDDPLYDEFVSQDAEPAEVLEMALALMRGALRE